MEAAYFDISVSDDLEMAKIDVLEERVNNHIRFFWMTVGAIVIALVWIGSQLYSINSHLGPLEGKVTKAELSSQAALPQPAFEQSLGDFKQAVTDARKKDVKIPAPVLSDIQSKLKTSNSSAQDYWPAVSEFVNYRSFLEGKSVQSLEALPVCRGPYTNAFGVPANKEGQVVGPAVPARIVEHDCKVVLDGIEASHMGYTDCLVIYHGGPVKQLSDVFFKNCVFKIDIPPSPPSEGKKIGETLLAANNLADVQLL